METVLIVLVCRTQSQVEQLLGRCSLSANRRLDALTEVLSQRGYRQQEVRLHLANICGNITQRLHRRTTHLSGCNRRTASDHNVETYNVSKAVVKRQNDQRTIGRRDLNTRERLLDIRRVVTVSQDHTLRVSRSTRGVGDGCVVVVLDRLTDRHKALAVLGQILLTLDFEHRESDLALLQILNLVHYDHLLQFGQALADTTDLGQLIFRNENRLNVGVIQAEQQVVVLLQLDRERHADSACIEQTQLRHNPRIATLRENRHAIAALDARCGQTCTDSQCLDAGLVIRCRLEFSCCFFEQECLFTIFGHR